MTSRRILTLRTLPDIVSATGRSTLIDRYTGRTDHATELRYAIPAPFPIEIRLIDTTDTGQPEWSPQINGIWHVLWIRDETGASARVTYAGRNPTWPIAPGDTLTVPGSATVSTTGGHLALAVASTQQSSPAIRPAPPTHGDDRFFGYNRQTVYPALDTVTTSRWKLTQPLDLSVHYRDRVLVVSLAGDPAIATSRESLTLRRGCAALVQVGEPATILPNGLGYIFVVGLHKSWS